MENFSDIGLMYECWSMYMLYEDYVSEALKRGEYVHAPLTYYKYYYEWDQHFGITEYEL